MKWHITICVFWRKKGSMFPLLFQLHNVNDVIFVSALFPDYDINLRLLYYNIQMLTLRWLKQRTYSVHIWVFISTSGETQEWRCWKDSGQVSYYSVVSFWFIFTACWVFLPYVYIMYNLISNHIGNLSFLIRQTYKQNV